MRFSHFFIDRPIFATVLSLLIVLIGGVAYVGLPAAQYPDIAPPTVVVRAQYPGANAQTVAATVATPLEQEINGVDNMLYMSSYSSGDGALSVTITFALGTDLDEAQVLVQNRVAIAEPRLPEEVRRLGVTTRKSSPDLMMVVHMLSPDDTFDQLYISGYARSACATCCCARTASATSRSSASGSTRCASGSTPKKLAAYGMTSSDVVAAIREQNVQVTGGTLGPAAGARPTTAFQLTVTTQGRFRGPAPVPAGDRALDAGRAAGARPGRGARRVRRAGLRHQLLSSTARRRSAWACSSAPAPTPSRPPRA
jgi:HAE1 family hydrophobic/amphiphilic exporter-1